MSALVVIVVSKKLVGVAGFETKTLSSRMKLCTEFVRQIAGKSAKSHMNCFLMQQITGAESEVWEAIRSWLPFLSIGKKR